MPLTARQIAETIYNSPRNIDKKYSIDLGEKLILELLDSKKEIKIPLSARKDPPKDVLISIICETVGIPFENFYVKTRKKEYAFSRFVFMKMKYRFSYSLKQIGFLLGGYDHSTIVNGLKSLESYLLDEKYLNLFSTIDEKLFELGY